MNANEITKRHLPCKLKPNEKELPKPRDQAEEAGRVTDSQSTEEEGGDGGMANLIGRPLRRLVAPAGSD